MILNDSMEQTLRNSNFLLARYNVLPSQRAILRLPYALVVTYQQGVLSGWYLRTCVARSVLSNLPTSTEQARCAMDRSQCDIQHQNVHSSRHQMAWGSRGDPVSPR